ncbi:hypothetical protein [Aminobacterium mobile]|uniref:hypothetical protein n=1 Tax=Aminobacterium mobile TaxID=81467 RepID=UPI000467B26B|nr:hypothetical protein [Aminobacterium mobile]
MWFRDRLNPLVAFLITFIGIDILWREAGALLPRIKLVARNKTIGKDLEYVKSSFMTQALAAGVDADVAKGNASLFEAQAKAILGRYGTNPREWYDRIGPSDR